VSTNDLVVCALARLTRADVVLMAANLRGRVACARGDDAGNYETMVPLLAADAATPALVRAALAPGRLARASAAAGPPLPSGAAAALSSAAVVTNWASFYADVRLPGAALVRHLPVAETHGANMESFVVYAPRAGDVAVVALTRSPRVTAETLGAAFAPRGGGAGGAADGRGRPPQVGPQ